MNEPEFRMIPMIDAGVLPIEVLDWCVDNDVPTHYDSGIAMFESNDDNPLNHWLKERGYKNSEKYTYVAIQGT